MKKAAVESLVKLAHEDVPEQVKEAYGKEDMKFGREYLIPTPFDHRLLIDVSFAVAKAACESGNSAKWYDDWEVYKKALAERVAAKQKAISKKVKKDKENYEKLFKYVRSNTVKLEKE